MLTLGDIFSLVIFRIRFNFLYNMIPRYNVGRKDGIIYLSIVKTLEHSIVPVKYWMERDNDNNFKCEGFTLFLVKFLRTYVTLPS